MSPEHRRRAEIAGQVVAAGAIVGAIAWIALADDKGIAIAGGIIAALLVRVAMVELPDWLDARERPPDGG